MASILSGQCGIEMHYQCPQTNNYMSLVYYFDVREAIKDILFEDNTILWVSELCSCVSVRWCFTELV